MMFPLQIHEHDFITILGGNGAENQPFNMLLGPLTSGSIQILGEDADSLLTRKQAKYLSRVFQDPEWGQRLV